MKLLKKIKFTFIVIILFFVSFETICKILKFPPVLISNQIEALKECWEETWAYQKKYHFNSMGLRGTKEIELKGDGVYRILCIGDSWTFGLNVKKEGTYPDLLENYLKNNKFKEGIEVINAGIPGYRIEEMRSFLKRNIDSLKPDCLIFLGGMNGVLAEEREDPNDERYMNFYSSKIGYFLSKSYFYNSLSFLIEYIQGLREYIIGDILVKNSDRESIGEFKELALLADFLDQLQKNGAIIILLNYPLPKREKGKLYGGYQDDYSFQEDDVLKTCLAKNPKFIFIDLFKIFKEIENCNELFLKMYYEHPNEKGYSVMAETIGRYLVRIVE